MSLKKIKPHVNRYCTFCKLAGELKVRAVWRISYQNEVACDKHKGELAEQERPDDGHRSEADYQTWMRL